MNRSTFALFVAVLIHLLIFSFLWFVLENMPKKKEAPTQEEKMKISLKEYMPKKKETAVIPDTLKAKSMPKGKQLKEPIVYQPQQKSKPVELNKPKEIVAQAPKPIIELLPTKESFIPLKESKQDQNTTKEKVKKEEESNPLYAFLSQDNTANETKEEIREVSHKSSVNQNLKELYGDEFGKLTQGQQKYLIDNQEVMRRITQEVLNRVADVNINRNLNVNRDNIVEFYLHPNGDMTDFKFLKQSGYYVLDDTTKETIEYAYSRYPRPEETILIRYIVLYNLAR
ncbi:MAG: hypothetical protein RBR59_03105 [Sulfurimonadaceae bacterium]|jgi:outer membrane biosynthesis protein TonB|nr:hypothetical protein [Sulfurimonadaceae bacterium]